MVFGCKGHSLLVVFGCQGNCLLLVFGVLVDLGHCLLVVVVVVFFVVGACASGGGASLAFALASAFVRAGVLCRLAAGAGASELSGSSLIVDSRDCGAGVVDSRHPWNSN